MAFAEVEVPEGASDGAAAAVAFAGVDAAQGASDGAAAAVAFAEVAAEGLRRGSRRRGLC